MANPNYSWAVTLIKGLVAGGGTTGAAAIVQWVLDGITTSDWSMKPETQGIVVSLISGGAAALWVMFKNYAKQKWGWILPVLVCAIALSSCNTVGPAISGKTEIETSFVDTINPDGSQNTQYNQKLKAPAGVEAKDLASMTYDWNEDGSGNIAVSSDRSADTMGQAELLKAAFEANNAQINMLFGALIQAAGIASPLIGQKLDLDAAAKAQESVNDAALTARIAEIVEKALDRKLKPKAATTPADSPLVDVPVTLPEVGNN